MGERQLIQISFVEDDMEITISELAPIGEDQLNSYFQTWMVWQGYIWNVSISLSGRNEAALDTLKGQCITNARYARDQILAFCRHETPREYHERLSRKYR